MRSRFGFIVVFMLTAAFLGVPDGLADGNTALNQAVLRHFKGAAAYSRKDHFSSSVPILYLAYDRKGNVIQGAALRKIKTYKRVTALLVIEKKNGKFIIRAAEIPDIDRIKGKKKQDKVLEVLKRLRGKVVKSTGSDIRKVDAVTGATRYHKRVYDGFNVMARKIVEQMEARPDWKKFRCNRHASTPP